MTSACACCKHRTAETACGLDLVTVHWQAIPGAPPADEFAPPGRLVRACKGCGAVCRLRTYEPVTPQAGALADRTARWPEEVAPTPAPVAAPAPQLALL